MQSKKFIHNTQIIFTPSKAHQIIKSTQQNQNRHIIYKSIKKNPNFPYLGRASQKTRIPKQWAPQLWEQLTKLEENGRTEETKVTKRDPCWNQDNNARQNGSTRWGITYVKKEWVRTSLTMVVLSPSRVFVEKKDKRESTNFGKWVQNEGPWLF